MISKFSQLLSRWLQVDGAITKQDQNLFFYAAYSFLFGTLPIVITVLLGLLLGMLREGIIMILPFMLIRKFSGGYHLNSPALCVAFSTTVLIVAFIAMKYILLAGHLQFLTVLTLISAVTIIRYSPIENSSRKLTCSEKQLFRKIARILTVITLGTFTFLRLNRLDEYSVSLGMGLILSAALQLPCLIAKKGK